MVSADGSLVSFQETLGEDPYLTSQLGATVVRSFQHGGLDEDKYLEVIATAKHFDVHGGPESASLDESGNLINTNRTRMHIIHVCRQLLYRWHECSERANSGAGMSFKVNISKRDWITMHQPAFQATVEAGVTSVMCSYNEINGVPSW
jgi:beta-glucosidase-like glycosyl hydrolase